ncbi:MAG: hypothetical protein J6D37_07275 [Clostridia bacterium]|nr:hypothetical protein [Clostridia bacterium]
MKKLNAIDFLPLGIVLLGLIGGILVAAHVQLAGLIIAIVALAAEITVYCLKGKLKLNVYVAYWSLVACAGIFLLSLLGFAGYTVWDIYSEHDVN